MSFLAPLNRCGPRLIPCEQRVKSFAVAGKQRGGHFGWVLGREGDTWHVAMLTAHVTRPNSNFRIISLVGVPDRQRSQADYERRPRAALNDITRGVVIQIF
jgi:hypothetical protein